MINVAGSSRHKNIATELLKIGNAKITAREFTLHELAAATDNFNPDSLLGEGGFGRVYKGYVESIEKVSLSLSYTHTHKQKLTYFSPLYACKYIYIYINTLQMVFQFLVLF